MKMAHSKGGLQALPAPAGVLYQVRGLILPFPNPPPFLTPRNNSQARAKPVLVTILETPGGSWHTCKRSSDRNERLDPDKQGLQDSDQGLHGKPCD